METLPRYVALTLLFAPMHSLLAGSVSAEERNVVEIGSPDFRAYPVAIPVASLDEASNQSRKASKVVDLLRWDFSLSPAFQVLDPKAYLADAKKEGMTADTIAFSDWTSVGADGLIKAAVRKVGASFRVELRFFEVASRSVLLSADKLVAEGEIREMVHTFANQVVAKLTGRQGIFLTKIAFVRKSRQGRELWTVDIDGENLQPVTRNGSLNLLPSWSADGSGLLFTSYLRHNPNLYMVPLSGGQPTLLAGESGLNTGGQMSPDGTRIMLTLSRDGNSEIYSMNANGTDLRRLTKEWAIDSSPSWSPDGKQVAFVSSRWGDPHLFVMNSDGTGVRRITEQGRYNQTPDWSPRGDVIAFTARDEKSVFDLFTVDPRTKVIKRLTQNQGNNEEPSFSPDGNHIVFSSSRDGDNKIYIMDADGAHQRPMTAFGGCTTPAWSPYLRSTENGS
jgi:TolB protein